MTTLSSLADAVLIQVEKDHLEKQAQVAYTSIQSLQTDTGKQLMKLAESLRIESGKVTYTDLARFRKNYGI